MPILMGSGCHRQALKHIRQHSKHKQDNFLQGEPKPNAPFALDEVLGLKLSPYMEGSTAEADQPYCTGLHWVIYVYKFNL